MPVRLKRRYIESKDEGEHDRLIKVLNKELIGLLLAWGRPTDVKVRGFDGALRLNIRRKGKPGFVERSNLASLPAFSLPLLRTVLSQAMYINPADWESWVKVSAMTPLLVIEGAISLEPVPSKSFQFMSIGVHSINASVGSNALFDRINRVFAASRFGVQEDFDNAEAYGMKPNRRRRADAFASGTPKASGKGVNRWPMFFIQINTHDNKAPVPTSPMSLLSQESTFLVIAKVLTAMITGFLEDNHFQYKRKAPRKQRRLGRESAAGIQKALPLSTSSAARSRIKEEHPVRRTGTVDLAEHDIQTKGSIPNKLSAGAHQSRGPVSNGLNREVEIPKFSDTRTRLSTGGFSSWSRIKSGSRSIEQELMSHKLTCQSQPCLVEEPSCPTNNFHKSMTEPAAITPTMRQGDAIAEPPTAIEDGDTKPTAPEGTIDSLLGVESQAVTPEEALQWVDPASKANISVNTRTGLVLCQSHTRPVSLIPRRRLSRLIRTSKQSSGFGLPGCCYPTSFTSPKEDSWVSGFLRGWRNPVFNQTEEPLPQVTFGGPDVEASAMLHGRHHRYSDMDVQHALTNFSASSSTQFSKSGLETVRVISQVEKKFILVSMKAALSGRAASEQSASAKEILVLIDQHAADERVRIEGLLTELCVPPLPKDACPDCEDVPRCLQSAIETTELGRPIKIDIPIQEHRLFLDQKSHFANWGILYDLTPTQNSLSISGANVCRLVVKTLPKAIAERCRLEPKILIELLRSDAWKREDSRHVDKSASAAGNAQSRQGPHEPGRSWLSRIHDCPQGILDMIISRSCRSAIMFNDELTIEECRSLIQRLAKCAFPFQCAHGRPSMIPLVDLSANLKEVEDFASAFGSRGASAKAVEGGIGFSQAWRNWGTRNAYLEG